MKFADDTPATLFSVEAAVPAAILRIMQATRLPLQLLDT
jgi:hypothetical protein